jgi:alpha(1,3/1,4) fucosyltransferase
MKKKTIKINFKYFWDGFDPEHNFFTNILKKEYHVVISENPDYLFYSVYPKISVSKIGKTGKLIKKISPRLYIFLREIYPKVILFFKGEKELPEVEGNFVKIFYGGEHVKPDMNKCDWAFSSEYSQEFNHPKHMRLPCYVINDFRLGKKAIPSIKKQIDFNKIKKEKTKFCNFIYSQDHLFRNNFFKELSKYKKIDSPGRCMNNMPPIGSHSDSGKSRQFKYWVNEKLEFLRPYKFTISFENADFHGWITEKLTHPMLVNSIPIYFGHRSVKRDFNTKSFINYHDFNNMKEFIEYIIRVDSDDKLYEKILREPWFNNNKIPDWFKEETYLKRFKEIFG